MSSVQFINTATEVTEREIINRKDYVLKIQPNSAQ